MKWLVLVVVISIIMIKAAEVLDRYARKNYIPLEEMMQRYAQPDKYVPWSYEKRMRYYDREVRLHRRPIPYPENYDTDYVQRYFKAQEDARLYTRAMIHQAYLHSDELKILNEKINGKK